MKTQHNQTDSDFRKDLTSVAWIRWWLMKRLHPKTASRFLRIRTDENAEAAGPGAAALQLTDRGASLGLEALRWLSL